MAALPVFPLPLLIDAITKQVLNPSRVSTDSFPVFIFPVFIFPVLVFPVFIAVITLIAFISVIAVVTVIAVIAIIAVVAVIIVIAITFIVFDEMDTDEDDSVVVFSWAFKIIGDLLRQNTWLVELEALAWTTEVDRQWSFLKLLSYISGL